MSDRKGWWDGPSGPGRRWPWVALAGWLALGGVGSCVAGAVTAVGGPHRPAAVLFASGVLCWAAAVGVWFGLARPTEKRK